MRSFLTWHLLTNWKAGPERARACTRMLRIGAAVCLRGNLLRILARGIVGGVTVPKLAKIITPKFEEDYTPIRRCWRGSASSMGCAAPSRRRLPTGSASRSARGWRGRCRDVTCPTERKIPVPTYSAT